MRARRTDGPLLPLTANALKKGFFERVIPKSGVVDFHFHDLRHEAISRLAESGRFGLLELQSISGHRDLRMLQRYAHLCAGNLAKKMDEVRGASVAEYVHRGRRRTVVKFDASAESAAVNQPAAGVTDEGRGGAVSAPSSSAGNVLPLAPRIQGSKVIDFESARRQQRMR